MVLKSVFPPPRRSQGLLWRRMPLAWFFPMMVSISRLLRYALFRKSQLRFNSRLTTDLSLSIASEISFCLYSFLFIHFCSYTLVYLCAKVRCAIIEIFGRGAIYPKVHGTPWEILRRSPLGLWKTHYTIQKEGGKYFPLSSEKMC